MANLRRNINRFFYNNRDKGIKNLMLYLAIGNVIVYFMSMVDPSNIFYTILCFDRAQILNWQLWRLLTFVFTYMNEQGLFWGAISLFLYYQFGRMLEQYWGVLRFNLYYLCGIVFMDAAALLIGGAATVYYLNLSIFLAVACTIPDMTVRLFFILPVKMKWVAWIDIGFLLYEVVRGIVTMCLLLPAQLYLGWLLPILAIANFFLFFGKETGVLLPDWMKRKRYPKMKKAKPNPNWADKYRGTHGEKPYRFKCTVCGKTDTEYPNLEFRYCSQCTGYRCYCNEHINHHAHIKED